MNYENELLSFCEGKTVFVYGAGKNQKKIKSYLIKKGVDVRGFVVSDSHFQDASNEIRISDLFKHCNKEDNYGIVVAVTEKYYNEIVRNIYNAGIDLNRVFITSNATKQEVIQGDMYSDVSIDCNEDIEKEYSRFKEYYEYIVNKCKINEYNLLCHLHLGDTLFFCF